MSLFAALSTAVSSIDSLNAAVRTVSDNVANAENEHYNRRTAEFENLQFGGVRIADVRRITNDGLQRDLFEQQSNAEADATRDRLYREIEQLTGTINSTTPLSDSFERFRTAWKAFEAAPETDAAATEVILAAESMLQEMGRLSDGLDLIENQVLVDIENQVDDLNQSLAALDDLNNRIVRDKAQGKPVASLQNLRDEEIETVAGLISIRSFERSDGSVSVYTTTGLDLTDRNASTFTWDAANRTLTKSGSPSTDLVTGGQLSDGALAASINFVRTDQTAVESTAVGVGALEKMRNQLDELAYALVDDASLASTSTVALADSQDVTTSTEVNITAGDTFDIDVDGAGPETVTINAGDTLADIAASINALPGGQDLRARVTAHNTLEIASVDGAALTLTDTDGALAELGFTLTASTRDPQTFTKAYEGATTQAGEATTFFEAESGTAPTSITRNNIRVNDTLTDGSETLKTLSGNDVIEALNGSNRQMIGSGTRLTNEDYGGLASGVLTEVVKRAERADVLATQSRTLRDDLRQALRDEVGVDIDEEMARLQVLQNSYSATARVISSVDQMFQALENAVR